MKSAIKLRAMKRSRDKMGLNVQIRPVEGLVKMESPDKGAKRFFYPAVVEYGHGHVPPHPFLRLAFDTTGDAAKNTTMNELLESTLREVVK